MELLMVSRSEISVALLEVSAAVSPGSFGGSFIEGVSHGIADGIPISASFTELLLEEKDGSGGSTERRQAQHAPAAEREGGWAAIPEVAFEEETKEGTVVTLELVSSPLYAKVDKYYIHKKPSNEAPDLDVSVGRDGERGIILYALKASGEKCVKFFDLIDLQNQFYDSTMSRVLFYRKDENSEWKAMDNLTDGLRMLAQTQTSCHGPPQDYFTPQSKDA